MSEYPKFKYCDDKEPVCVHGRAEEDALGLEWRDSPSKENDDAEKAAIAEREKQIAAGNNIDEIREQLEELSRANVELEAKLEEAENFIETQAARIAELEGDEGGEATEGNEGVEASDAAVKLADEHGISLDSVTGTGSNGNITKGDVQKVIDEAAEANEGEGNDEDENPED